MSEKVQHYLNSWNEFELYCNNKAKGRCLLNNAAWRKLRDFYLNKYLTEIEKPYAFLFAVRHFHIDIYRSIRCMAKYYYRYAKLRAALIQEDPMARYKKVIRQKRKIEHPKQQDNQSLGPAL